VERTHSLPQYVIFAVVKRSEDASEIQQAERCEVIDHGNQIYTLVLSLGFAEPPFPLLDMLQSLVALGPAAVVPRTDISVWLSAQTVYVTSLIGGPTRRMLLSIYSELKSAFPGCSHPVSLPPENTITVGCVCPLS